MAGEKTLEEQIAAGKVILEGDATVLQKLASTMVEFDSRFEIMPGTKAKDPSTEEMTEFEQKSPSVTGE